MNPLFSILLPTKNRLDLLRYAIETVRRQDYSTWEIVVSDNHSEEDIGGYVASLADPRIIHVRTERPLHVTDNWNNALDRCRGDYVIMLGDDDGLTKGYLSRMAGLIAEHGGPDLVFTSAYIYAYPGVIPGYPDGFLKRDASPIFAAPAPYVLDPARAASLAREALRLRMAYPFNMQYSLVGRALVEEMKRTGPFYRSPYPDYYATPALFLTAKRILVDPSPQVIIGVSPKSYGFYHFNDQEDAGAQFLDNSPSKEQAEQLRAVLLPGTRAASAWLVAAQCLKNRFGLEVDYGRYRRMQMGNYFKRRYLKRTLGREEFAVMLASLSWRERWLSGTALAVALIAIRLFGEQRHQRLITLARLCTGNAHAGSLDLTRTDCTTTCRTLLEVFEGTGAPLA